MDWWKKAVFYQIYPRSFMDSDGDGIGDLPGIISKLDYLNDGTPASLGVDAIWFSPFYPSPQHDFGYDVADYCAVDPVYGTMDDFDRLLQECHRRGIKVMLDLVVNHTSHEHPWFKESRSSRDNPKRDWYIWRDGRGRRNRPPNNWRNNFFGSAWTWDEKTGQYYLHSFLKEQPDLNWYNPQVKKAVFEAVRFWLDKGVDGYRLDVAHMYCKDEQLRNNPPFFLPDRIPLRQPMGDRFLMDNLIDLLGAPQFQRLKYNQHHPQTHRIHKEFRALLDSYSGKTSVGEVLGIDPRQVAAYYGSGNDELHMNFYFEMIACRWKAAAFRRCVDKWEKLLPPEAWPAYTLSNHDRTRAITRLAIPGHEDEQARLLAMMLLTLRGTPFIYYGEEIGMKDAVLPKHLLKDPAGIKWYPVYRGRDGQRTPMQWTGEPGGGFSTGEPWLPVGPEVERRNVAVQEKDGASLLNFYKKLIWLRKESPVLLEGGYRSVAEGVPGDCYVYLRESQGNRLLVALNFATAERKVQLLPAGFTGPAKILLSTLPGREGETCSSTLDLAPLEGCLCQIE